MFLLECQSSLKWNNYYFKDPFNSQKSRTPADCIWSVRVICKSYSQITDSLRVRESDRSSFHFPYFAICIRKVAKHILLKHVLLRFNNNEDKILLFFFLTDNLVAKEISLSNHPGPLWQSHFTTRAGTEVPLQLYPPTIPVRAVPLTSSSPGFQSLSLRGPNP